MDMQTLPVAEVHARLAAQQHRRFVKSHTPLGGLPWDERVTYIGVGRDPRDVALSWDNHRSNLNLEDFFAARARSVGTDDLAEMMPEGPPPPPPEDPAQRYGGFIEDSSPPEAMRARAADLVPESHRPAWQDIARFFHSGTSGRWRDMPGDPDDSRYADAVAHLAPPELLDRVHRGPSWRAS
jgi:hypothetical protein